MSKDFKTQEGEKEIMALEKTMYAVAYFKDFLNSGRPLYGAKMEVEPPLTEKEKSLLVKNEDGSPDNSRIFGYYLLMKRLLPEKSYGAMRKDIVELTEKYPSIDLKYGYGFPDNWKEIL